MATGSRNRSGQDLEPPLASPPTSFELDALPQDQCPLFSLPAELRVLIFEHALTDYEFTDYFYLYSDPIHRATRTRRDYRPRRSTSIQLLRTCQRVYCETWLMPFILAEHIFYLFHSHPYTNDDTRDVGRYLISRERMENYLQTLKESANIHDETLHIPHIQSIRIYFNHSFMKGPSTLVRRMINKRTPPEFSPKCVTFSLNYKNSWMKSMFGYKLSGKWVNNLRFPNSVTCIRMELGKFSDSPQIRIIVSQLVSKWFFRREDGMVFRAVANDVTRRLWIANEALRERDPRRERLYVIPMVTWRLADGFDPFADGYQCPDFDFTSLALQMDRTPLGDITGAINTISGTG